MAEKRAGARRERQNDVLAAAEAELIEAWRLLHRLPDRERGWLSQITLRWPAMVKDAQADYADAEAAPPLTLSRREVARVERAFLHEFCLVSAIPPAHLKLCAVVLGIKAGRQAGGFAWEDVWQAMGGKRCGATTDALRARYEASLLCVAIRLGMFEHFGGAGEGVAA